ncbi:DDHD domain-containing protein [Mucor mucedo]|uniref:DDHD domain-containing protein n=1 Tax=Mucor mucedo TaxID=29922 RepID=UPI00221FA198|nr:DDHD domain-containing protein [Mucor mucedo]KAI7895978.1 DDHD domain-containing protein [Mucor mucedo]
MKSTWPIAVSGTGPLNRAHGIQVLPILWRQGILFGNDPTDDKSTLESDMGLPDADDGCPTIDEITLDGAPNIRTLVSDVFLDIPLYLTSRYHSQMIHIVTKEVNRVYKLFIQKNPEFLPNNGQVSILAHSLGSLLALDILSAQPFTGAQLSNVKNAAIITEKKTDTLDFPVKNYFAIGSPQGMIMILRGHKMVSRKTLASTPIDHHTYSEKAAPVSFIYPAADNIYNIFHKSDPVAYRLEPLVVRHYGSKLKPFPIPYIKGGLKSVLDHGYNVTHDFANRAGAMFESIRTGFTGSLFMRGLGFSKPVMEGTPAETELPSRSLSDPALLASRAEAKSAAKLKALNPNGRLDFYLQEGLLENTYISALSAHMSYWQDVDVAGFLIREVYKNQQLEQEAQKT